MPLLGMFVDCLDRNVAKKWQYPFCHHPTRERGIDLETVGALAYASGYDRSSR
jgi:hypothetical protein